MAAFLSPKARLASNRMLTKTEPDTNYPTGFECGIIRLLKTTPETQRRVKPMVNLFVGAFFMKIKILSSDRS